MKIIGRAFLLLILPGAALGQNLPPSWSSQKTARDCPTIEDAQPPGSVLQGDFVELSRSGCFGTCPMYEVKVSAGGDVRWNGKGYVQSTGPSHSRIDPDAARALVQEFLVPQFWGLCGGYSASVTDNATTQIKVQIGGRSKTVWNYANSAPEWVKTFEDAIDAAANTHIWRHGKPRTEPLSNIFQDAYMSKPGVTPLMSAAAGAEINSIKEAIAHGEDVDATDSSGWTALMYAAVSSHSEPVQLLLAAGANPNHRSFAGDTPLMASAIARQFDEDIWRAGGQINAKNAEGVTTLMILASMGEADEVKEALKAGADPFARDGKGRSALDYLRLAKCGKSPIPDWRTLDTGGKCEYLDEEEVQQVTSVLKSAKRKPKR